MGCLICSFMPAFWLGNTYGMPTIVAFLLLVTSLLLFYEGLGSPGPARDACIFLAAISCFLAAGFKADIVLLYGLYFFILFVENRLTCQTSFSCACSWRWRSLAY